MNTRKLRKAILTLCSALLLVSLSVGITVAYLTSTDTVVNTFTTGKVEIMLDEAVKVQEYYDDGETPTGNWVETTEKDENGEQLRTKTNEYKLYPGCEYAKDPTVTVIKGSEDSYVRVLVTLKNSDQLDQLFDKYENDDDDTNDLSVSHFIEGYKETEWILASNEETSTTTTEKDEQGNDVTTTINYRTYELRYFDINDQNYVVEAELVENAKLALTDVFTKIIIPENMTVEDMALLNGVEITIVAQAIQAEGFENVDAAWEAWN